MLIKSRTSLAPFFQIDTSQDDRHPAAEAAGVLPSQTEEASRASVIPRMS